MQMGLKQQFRPYDEMGYMRRIGKSYIQNLAWRLNTNSNPEIALKE